MEEKVTPYLVSEEMAYVKSAKVSVGTAIYISAGRDIDSYFDDTPLEEAENKVLGKTVSISFSDSLTANLKAGDKVKVSVGLEPSDGEDLRWHLEAWKAEDFVKRNESNAVTPSADLRSGRLCNCNEVFEISEDGNYILVLTNYSTNPITVTSATIEIVR